jgi:hypothetical protein
LFFATTKIGFRRSTNGPDRNERAPALPSGVQGSFGTASGVRTAREAMCGNWGARRTYIVPIKPMALVN